MTNGVDVPLIYEGPIDFDTDRVVALEQSEKRAWRVAMVAASLMVLSWVGMVVMLPLKEIQLEVVRVDNNTGATDIISSLKETTYGYHEAEDKRNLRDYVTDRESYNLALVQRNADLTVLRSTGDVSRAYQAQYRGNDSLIDKYGSTFQVNVNVLSVVPGTGKSAGTAQVRFVRTIHRVVDTSGGSADAAQGLIATIAYEYRMTQKMKEGQRMDNPLGFTVTAYRIDADKSGVTK